MRAVVQRVSEAAVSVDGRRVSSIGKGLLVLLGVERGDEEAEAATLARKICRLRIFEDAAGRMNLSVSEAGGAMLAVSQFTLMADCRKGCRPSFANAAPPEEANPLYEIFCELCEQQGVEVGRGVFAAHMEVALVNDGPVTIIISGEDIKRTK